MQYSDTLIYTRLKIFFWKFLFARIEVMKNWIFSFLIAGLKGEKPGWEYPESLPQLQYVQAPGALPCRPWKVIFPTYIGIGLVLRKRANVPYGQLIVRIIRWRRRRRRRQLRYQCRRRHGGWRHAESVFKATATKRGRLRAGPLTSFYIALSLHYAIVINLSH